MSTWDDLRETAERLRLSTARMKAKRLNLPEPGTLLRVCAPFVFLSVVKPGGEIPRKHDKGTLALLITVFPFTAKVKGTADEDMAEMVLLIGETLWTTGKRGAADVLTPYEVL